jgi:hypothetical protein
MNFTMAIVGKKQQIEFRNTICVATACAIYVEARYIYYMINYNSASTVYIQ